MLGDINQNKVKSFAGVLLGLKTPKQILKIAAQEIASIIGCERVGVSFLDENFSDNIVWASEPNHQDYVSPFTLAHNCLKFDDYELTLPLVINDVARSSYPVAITRQLEQSSLNSLMIFPLQAAGRVFGWIECQCLSRFRRWRKEDYILLKALAESLSLFLKQAVEVSNLLKKEMRYRLIIDQLPGMVVEISDHGEIIYFNKAAAAHTSEGQTLEDFLSGLLDPNDLAQLQQTLSNDISELISDKKKVIENQSKLKNSQTKSVRIRITRMPGEEGRLLFIGILHDLLVDQLPEVQAIPTVTLDNTLQAAQSQLLQQNRKIEALYEVARALNFSTDPSVVTLKGLRALVKATTSDGGLAFMYDRTSRKLELVASEGVSSAFIEAIESSLPGDSLVRNVAESGQGVLSDNMQQEPSVRSEIARIENIRSVILQPLIFEDNVLGVVFIFCREAGRFTNDDFDLVKAATSQVAVAARQAEVFSASKRQANSLAALYRLSHELSQYLTVEEVSQHAFKILHEVLACKRMWLGVMNEQRTHIKGLAGFGPGIRKPLIDLQIELNLRHDFLDDALSRREPVIVPEDAKAECSGLNRIVKNLKLGAFVILPLVSLGQIVGVLLIEPAIAQGFFNESKLSLLNSMAGEIAAVILARRFEARIAESDKMRMAGLLASGVAHNFNNLLQAIMGQASLIQLQLPSDSPANKSSSVILEAAERGGQLVRQLMAFSQPNSLQKKKLSINQMVLDSRDFYRSVLGPGIDLKLDLRSDVPEIDGDYSQLQQAITNMLINSKEAIPEGRSGFVKLSTVGVRLRSNEVDPELPPGYYLRINLEDNGLGMDEERRARCFEPFFTTKNIDKTSGVGISGSGLGLSSAYSVLKQHQGLITVQSYLGEGTVFSVYLPAYEPRANQTLSSNIEASPVHKEVVQKIGSIVVESSNGHTNGNGIAKQNGVGHVKES